MSATFLHFFVIFISLCILSTLIYVSRKRPYFGLNGAAWNNNENLKFSILTRKTEFGEIATHGNYRNQGDAYRSKATEPIKKADIVSLSSLIMHEFNLSFKSKDKRILGGKWLDIFPEVRHMLQEIETGRSASSINGVTSAKQSVVTFDKKRKYFEGNTWKGLIKSYDRKNNPKSQGGDYYKASLYRSERIIDGGVSCTVKDNQNGTYGVECPLPWQGRGFVRVFLQSPKETVYLNMLITSKMNEELIIKNTSFINSFKQREYSICDMDLWDKYNDSDLCDHSNQHNGEPWFCVKTTSGECPALENQLEKIVDKDGGKAFRRNKYRIEPAAVGSGDPVAFSIRKRPVKMKRKLETCSKGKPPSVYLDPQKATGWFEGRSWTSFQCLLGEFGDIRFVQCMKNKYIYVVGDSVASQWFRFMYGISRSTGKLFSRFGWSEPQNTFSKIHNITLHYRGHGPPLHGPGPPLFHPYISNTIDSIKHAGRETHFLVSFGPHFGGYHPDVFLNRLVKIKKAMLRLLSRSPDVTFYIAGIIPHSPWEVQPSEWIMYRQEILMRSVLGNMKGVIYLQFWDMASVIMNKKVHVLNDLLRQQMRIFNSYLCS
ncbi:NXPE family member 4-like [Styela clava]